MKELLPVLARIVLRYGAGALVAYGLLAPSEAEELVMNPDLALLVGGLIGVAVEGAYTLARRKGWAT